jgi:predicted RNA-binding protein (TIGR00451 family)
MEVRSLKAVLEYQFGRGAARLLEGDVRVRRSPTTGRAREVYVGGVLVGTVRATDNFFVPTVEGARKLLELIPHPRLRVVVPEGVAEYVARGRTVFCKHVVEADAEIRPGEEVFVVDAAGKLVALGKAVVGGAAMLSKKAGKAVKVRKGVEK